MEFYYAVFNQTDEAVEVYFPDIENALTFADTWDDAVVMATDVLAAVLVGIDVRPKRTPFSELAHLGHVVPICVDERIMQSYEPTTRVNVSLPVSVLKRIDSYRSKHSLKRSAFLAKAAEEFMTQRP